MSATSAAIAPSASEQNTKREVTSRTTLWQAGVVEITVPDTATLHTQKGTRDGDVTYLYWSHSLRGGRVGIHLRDTNLSTLKGKKINARMVVSKKTYSDGNSDLYIDLFPTMNPATFIFGVSQEATAPERIMKIHKNVSVFKAPEPKIGVVWVTERKSPKKAEA